jgi:hypothetical protein
MKLSDSVRVLLTYGEQASTRAMKRSPIRRRPRRNRDLSPEDWARLRLLVGVRDEQVVRRWMAENGYVLPRVGQLPPACPAVVMDPSQWGTCSGPWHQDHVKDDPKIGEKAPDDEDHLISLCATHDERGMRRGHQWNTAHRAEERKYLQDRRRERAARA